MLAIAFITLVCVKYCVLLNLNIFPSVDLDQCIDETCITKAMLYWSMIMWWRMVLPYLSPVNLRYNQRSIDSTLYRKMDDEALLEN